MIAKILGRLRPMPVILGISAISGSGLVAAIAITGMDVQTLLTSFSAKQITIADLQQQKVKPIILVDVRSPEEYAEDRIAKSVLVPIAEIEAGSGVDRIQTLVKNNLKPNQSKPTIVLYCTKGVRATKAYRLLEKSGLNIAVLSGSLNGWRKEISPEKDVAILTPVVFQLKNLKATSLPAVN